MRKKKEEKSEEDKYGDKQVNRFFVACALIPLCLVSFMHLFNYFFYENGTNLNPDGVGNAEWLGF